MGKKSLTLILLIVTSIGSNAQIQLPLNKIGNTEEIIETTLTKAQMWTNLKKWVSEEFHNYKYAVDMEDKETGNMIIKWNETFVPKETFILMTVKSTYQIDIKENKYRIRVFNSAVELSPNSNNFESESSSHLKRVIEGMTFITNISAEYYNKSTLWPMDQKYVSLLDKYEKSLDSIPKYKDVKKAKLNKEWNKQNDNINILREALSGYITYNSSIYESFKKAIIYKDNF